jgi:type I restriction enzyme S subunit
MELKAAYKQTDMGEVPEDWSVGRLDSFWSVTDCKHVTADFVPNGYPVASIREVQSRFVDLSNANQTTLTFYTQLTEGGRKPRAGDLILSRNATVGELAQVAESHPPFAMGQDVCLLRKHLPDFSTNYLQSVFRSTIVTRQINDSMVGSTFKRINVQHVKSLIVSMPSPIEQRRIAEALSDADKLIESLEQLLVKKRQIKQGAMQELLTGKKRLSGFTGDWTPKVIGDLLQIHHGKSQHGVESLYGPYPILATGGQIGNANRFLCDHPSVLIGRKGTIDQPQYMDEPFWCVDTLFTQPFLSQISRNSCFIVSV